MPVAGSVQLRPFMSVGSQAGACAPPAVAVTYATAASQVAEYCGSGNMLKLLRLSLADEGSHTKQYSFDGEALFTSPPQNCWIFQ